MNKRELNERLLKFAGFTCSEGIWCYPDGVALERHPPIFPESLDACFEWLVPKLAGWYICKAEEPDMGGDCFAAINGGKYHEWAQTPALALCLTISKLIDSEGGDATK